MYKAICTDIDGTLLNTDRELSPKTLSVLREVKHNIPIILASSRMPAAMRHLQEAIGTVDEPLICYNGGYIVDIENSKVIDSTEITYNWVAEVVRLSALEKIHASLYSEDNWYAPANDEWTNREENNTKVSATIRPNAEVLAKWQPTQNGAHKIMLMGDAPKIDRIVESLIKQEAPLHLYRSKDTYLEIAPNSISKALALKKLLAYKYDILIEEIVAFGDNFNDIELLKSVGHGVAVANAKDAVKAIANEVVEAGKHDGVAKTIERYFLTN